MLSKSKKYWLVVVLFLIAFAVCNIYDYFGHKYDGIIHYYRYNRILVLIALIALLVQVLALGLKRRKGPGYNAAMVTVNVIVIVVVLEIISGVLLKFVYVSQEKPRHHLFNSGMDLALEKRPFWGDMNRDFAKWRLPNDTMTLKACHGEKIFFKTNAYGARDKERTLKSNTGKRVVFLGDSFVEGFMVNTEDRVSDLLEKKTGLEHLNFGINGTSPINYYLTYKHLAKQFEHDVVIIGLLPANDFEDFTEERKPDLIRVPIYRPYWKLGESPYKLAYSLDSLNMSANSVYHFEHADEVFKTIDSVFEELNTAEKIKGFVSDNSYTYQLLYGLTKRVPVTPEKPYSRFNTYTKDEWKILSHSLEKLFKEAEGKQVIVMLYPILDEIKAYGVTKQNMLSKELKALCARNGVTCIDLLPDLYQFKGNYQDLYVACDGHWSKKGEKLVSDLIYDQPGYRNALETK